MAAPKPFTPLFSMHEAGYRGAAVIRVGFNVPLLDTVSIVSIPLGYTWWFGEDIRSKFTIAVEKIIVVSGAFNNMMDLLEKCTIWDSKELSFILPRDNEDDFKYEQMKIAIGKLLDDMYYAYIVHTVLRDGTANEPLPHPILKDPR